MEDIKEMLENMLDKLKNDYLKRLALIDTWVLIVSLAILIGMILTITQLLLNYYSFIFIGLVIIAPLITKQLGQKL